LIRDIKESREEKESSEKEPNYIDDGANYIEPKEEQPLERF